MGQAGALAEANETKRFVKAIAEEVAQEKSFWVNGGEGFLLENNEAGRRYCRP